MVPSMSYDGMEIGDGDSASTIYARMARGEFSPTEMDRHRSGLLAYCKLDTLAMVKLHARLCRLVSPDN